jgi:hypothetical protein
MRKHHRIFSCCKPSFDRLEERALLSVGNPGTPGLGQMMRPTPPPIHSEPAPFSPFVSVGGQGNQGGWAQSSVGSRESQPPGMMQPQPTGDRAPQPMGSSSDSPIVGPTIPFALASQPQLGSAPILGNPSNAGPAPGSNGNSQAKGQPEATEPAGPASVDAPAAAASVGTGKDVGEELGGVNNTPIGPAASSPPAQRLSVLDADNAVSTRLLSPDEVSVPANPLVGVRTGRGSLTATGQPGSANRTRAWTIRTADPSTSLTDGSRGEFPGPRSADLIANVLPFDRDALDRAIDHFFQRFEELNPGELVGKRPAHIVLCTLALATTFAALDLVRRRLRLTKTGKDARVRHPLAMAGHVGFPELPASWFSRMS